MPPNEMNLIADQSRPRHPARMHVGASERRSVGAPERTGSRDPGCNVLPASPRAFDGHIESIC
ncbi:MAG: hypothetical protein GYA24_14290 [Candidatus Lokiarchaeota archaeon]|nr:hypothetical protein [Candidatus Lokiarchaeota archaeon]